MGRHNANGHLSSASFWCDKCDFWENHAVSDHACTAGSGDNTWQPCRPSNLDIGCGHVQPDGPALYVDGPGADLQGRLLLALNDTCLVGTDDRESRSGSASEEGNSTRGWGWGWGHGDESEDDGATQLQPTPAPNQGGNQQSQAAIGLMLSCSLGRGQVRRPAHALHNFRILS